MKKIFTILFFALLGLNNINAATFSSVASGTWSAPATWSVTGTDADGIPDADDDVTINGAHSVILINLQNYFKTLLINSGGTLNLNSKVLNAYGNLTNNGAIVGTFYYFKVFTPAIISSSSPITNPGEWYFSANTTIAAGTVINKTGNNLQPRGNAIVTNLGSVTGKLYISNTASWVNGSNSFLQLSSAIGGTVNLNCSASGNTVVCASTCSTVPSTTYYNLITTSSSSGTKTALGNIIVLNNLTMTSGRLNMNNFNLTIGGNWLNQSNYNVLNQGTVTFNTSSSQTISKTTSGNEVFTNMTISGSGTTTLAKDITVTQNLTINSGVFDVSASNYSISVGGNLTNDATLNCRNGLINLAGTTAQNISGSSNTQFYALTLNNTSGATVNSAQSVTDVLTVTNGNFNSNGNLTLISDASKTARLGVVGASGSFSGSMTIQKFITTRAANYHDLSSSVSNSTIMDWDDDLYMSGIGPYDGITGPAGVDGNSGSDSSVYNWNEPTGSWQAVTGSSYPLAVSKAYEIFIADDLTSWTGRAIDTKGTPNFGNQTVNVSYTGSSAYAGLNLIGNPFAASIDYAACSKVNVSGSVLILDDSGNYNDYGTSPVIPSNQGFWVSATSAGSVTFLETAKTTNTATTYYRSVPNYGIKLMLSSPVTPFYHENTVNFESNTTLGFDIEKDALFIKSPNKNAPALFMLTQTDAKLITNTINSDEQHVTIPLGLYTPKTGIYYIEPSILNSYDYNYVWIENTKTGTKYELDHTITIEGNENETNTDYVIHLSKVAKTSETSLSGFENDIVIFNTENAINLKSYKSNHQLNQVLVYDLTGKLILEVDRLFLESGKIAEIDITSFAKGLYIVKAIGDDNQIISKKIIR